jgi:uncharacterized protein (DUF4415 family)
MTSEDIRNRQWTEKERQAVQRVAQLASMTRLRDARRKVPVGLRLDPMVLDWLKSKGEGHHTRINDILLNLMEAAHRPAAKR